MHLLCTSGSFSEEIPLVTNLLPLAVLKCLIPSVIFMCWVQGKWDRHRTESPSPDKRTRLYLLSTLRRLVPKTGVVGNELMRSPSGAKEGVSPGSWNPPQVLHFPNSFGQFFSASLASALPAV
uniref:Uncharacterized protein n=1 Tax=Falco tinnunculus TaxID=100819 RepID=A0A8C4UCZ5_FALTI